MTLNIADPIITQSNSIENTTSLRIPNLPIKNDVDLVILSMHQNALRANKTVLIMFSYNIVSDYE